MNLFQQPKVVVPRQSGCLKIVADDEDRHLGVRGDHDGAWRPFTDIGPVAAFLARKAKPSGKEDAFEPAPVNGGEVRHGQRSGGHACAGAFDTDPGWTPPARAVRCISRFLEHVGERSLLGGGPQKQMDGFVQRGPGGGGRLARAGHVEGHGVRDVLVARTPSLHGELDLHSHRIRAAPIAGNAHVWAPQEAAFRWATGGYSGIEASGGNP